MVDRRDILLAGGALALGTVGAGILALRQMGTMDEYNAAAAVTREALSKSPDLLDFVRLATLAASGHNTQPWLFGVRSERIDILPDFSRRTPVVDPDDHHLFASLGCAAENLAVAAGSRGRPGEVRFNSENRGAVAFEFKAGAAADSNLADAIARRQSTRALYDGNALSAADLKALAAAAADVPGVDLVLFTQRPQIDRIRDLVLAGNDAQMADPAFLRELKGWLRFSPREAIASGDGLFSAASGSPPLPAWLGPLAFDITFKAAAERDKYARHLASSAGVAVFVSQRDDPEHWMLAGRACQRFSLQATALGIKTAFINQPVEVARLRPELASLAGLPGRRPDIVMRFGHGPEMPFSSRRDVEAVLS